MLSRIKESHFYQAIIFSIPFVFQSGKRQLTTIAVAQVITAILTPVTAILLGKMALTIKEILEDPSLDMSPLTPWILLAGGISLIIAGCRIASKYCNNCLGDKMALMMQHKVTSHISSLNLELIENHKVQDILERGQQSPGRTMLKFTTGFLAISSSLLRIVGLLGVLFWVSPLWAGLISLFSIPALIGNRYLSRINFNIKISKTTARRWSKYYTSTLTNRMMIPSVVTLGISDLFLKRFDESMTDINKANRKFYLLQVKILLGATLLTVFTLMIAIVTVAKDTSAGLIEIGGFTAFWIAAWRIQVAISGLGSVFLSISEAEFTIFNIRELFALRNTLPSGGTIQPSKKLGDIEIRNLTFIYQGTTQPVLKNLSMKIHEGETIAIVGPNGSGKTTLVKLIAQLYSPTKGDILFDEKSAFAFDRKMLYQNMSIVSQSPVQFEATAFDNIALGDWNQLQSNPEAVYDLAKKVKVDEMISKMPEGYQTLLGRKFGSYDISGGQRQKLALARALACDPALIILDEPTSAQDIQTEFEFYSNIKRLTRDKTTILISHRFSTVRMADRIFVLNEGSISEYGTHNELIESGGLYASMSQMHEQMTIS